VSSDGPDRADRPDRAARPPARRPAVSRADARTTDPARPDPVRPDVPLADLTPPRQVAAAALGRARRAAVARGFRPGDPPKRRPTAVASGTAGPGPRDPLTAGAALEAVVGQLGWAPGIAAGSLQARWAEILGPEVAEHAQYESFEHGVLRMRASSTSWATNLTWAVPTMLRRFAEELGEGVVVEVQVLGPGGPGFGRGPRRVPGRGVRDTYG